MKKINRILLILTILLAVLSLTLGGILTAKAIRDKKEEDAKPDPQAMQKMADSFSNDLHNIRYYMEISDIRDICKEQEVVSVYRYTHDGAFSGISIIEFRELADGTGSLSYTRYNCESYLIIKGVFEDVTFDLTAEETSTFLQCVEENKFYEQTTIHPEESDTILDGAIQYLEGDHADKLDRLGVVLSNYRLLCYRSEGLFFDYPAFTNIAEKMIDMVESKGCEVRFNYCGDEEALRNGET